MGENDTLNRRKVSVILCFYNEEKYLADAIKSVLNQTYTNFELILVSDGSTDRSCEIADSFDDVRIKRVYLKENHGLANARNAGYDVAEGEYIAHFDGDDLLLPDKLDAQVRYLDEHPQTVVVSCGYYPMDEDGIISKEPTLPKYISDEDIRAAELFSPVIVNAGGPIFRRELVTEYGIRNDSTMLWCEDYFFWQQSLKYGKIENIPGALFCYRISYGSHTQKQKKENYDKYLDAMFRILSYAWRERGFILDDKDIMFIIDCFCVKRKMIGISELIFSKGLYSKIESQIKSRQIMDGAKVLEIYKKVEMENLALVKLTRKVKSYVRKRIL